MVIKRQCRHLSLHRKTFVILILLMFASNVYYFTDISRTWKTLSYRSNYRYSFEEWNAYLKITSERSNTYPISSEKSQNEAESKIELEISKRLEAASDKKIILIWPRGYVPRIPIAIDRRQCGNCEVTYNESLISDERTQAVVFHFNDIWPGNMPTSRNPNQMYVFWSKESTASLKVARQLTLEFENSYKFNATMTYRLDSSFSTSYQNATLVGETMGKDESIYSEIMKEKSKFALVMISNCGTAAASWERLKKIKELMNLDPGIDGFGLCFGRQPSRSEDAGTIMKYKFYFAYENSRHCKEYITEKFFRNALTHHAVPVVWGATKNDYEAIAPPGSFIYAEDFATPLQLLRYLRFLDQVENEYLKYFRWLTLKPEILPQYKRTREWCAICRELHGINADERFSPKYDASKPFIPLFTDGLYRRSVPSLLEWFYGEDNRECFDDDRSFSMRGS